MGCGVEVVTTFLLPSACRAAFVVAGLSRHYLEVNIMGPWKKIVNFWRSGGIESQTRSNASASSFNPANPDYPKVNILGM